MNQPAPDLRPAPEATIQVRASDLASFVAAKLCHDFVSPAGAVVSGLDLLKDPSAQDMREDAMALIEASAEKLVAMAHFARVAFGASTSAERFDPAQVKTLADGAFAGLRASLEWTCDVDTLSKPQARALLNLAQITGGALAHGGVARLDCVVEGDTLVLKGTAEGPRARLKPEVVTGLSGDTLTEGLAGQWIQPYWLWLTVAETGGTMTHSVEEGRVEIIARMPR